jgi:hypothetical protein
MIARNLPGSCCIRLHHSPFRASPPVFSHQADNPQKLKRHPSNLITKNIGQFPSPARWSFRVNQGAHITAPSGARENWWFPPPESRLFASLQLESVSVPRPAAAARISKFLVFSEHGWPVHRGISWFFDLGNTLSRCAQLEHTVEALLSQSLKACAATISETLNTTEHK